MVRWGRCVGKEELYDKVVEIRAVSDRVMSLAIVLEEVVRVVCAYAPQSGKWMEEKGNSYEDLSREWSTHHMSEMIIGMGDHNGHVGSNIDGFQGAHGGISIGKRNQEGRMLLEFCDAKHLCIAKTWFGNVDKKQITYGSGCDQSEIDLCIMGKVDRKFLKNVKVITGELKHNLVIVDIDMKQTKKLSGSLDAKNEI